MGLLDIFRFGARVGGGGVSSVSGYRSPWSAAQLSKIAWADVLGLDAGPVSRDEAMRVPAVVKARALICGTLSRQPLAKFRGDQMLTPDPWMYRTSGQVPPSSRLLWTLDDLIFGGASLWQVQRGTRSGGAVAGPILDAWRVPPQWWEITPDLDVLVQGEKVGASDVILFEGPQEGLLTLAEDDIRAARAMGRAWQQRVDAPVPLVELHVTDASMEPTEDEAVDLVREWEESRRHGGTALTPAGLQVVTHGSTPTDLFVAGRNASRLDFGNFLNIPAALLEGSQATATLTYSTTEGRRNELVDYSLSYWAQPIAARLSMDDVTPRGTRVDFDLEWLSQAAQPAQGPASSD